MDSNSSKYAQKTVIREMIFASYFAGELDKESVILRLNISSRQFYRLQNKYKCEHSLQHGLCNKPSNYQIAPEIKQAILDLYKFKYKKFGFNYDHYCEMLSIHEGIIAKPDCVRKWLREAKLTLPRKRGTKKVTTWREPKAQFNEMVQIDGTFGYFLGNDQLLCLMHLVDDATRTSMAILCNAECTQSALLLLYKWCLKYGIPKSIYSDRHSTYKVNERKHLTIEEELEGQELRLSEFGKVCNELGINHIFAYSPQAKGRVENKHKLYKDRCVKEVKLLNYKTIDEVNDFLIRDGGFTDRLNRKFTIPPREVAKSAVVLPTDTELAQRFALNNIRTVRNDYTVHLDKVVYQLSRKSVINHGTKVNIKWFLDGSIAIFAGNIQLEHSIISNYTKPIKKAVADTTHAQNKQYKPSLTHPYRQYNRKSRYQLAGSKQLQQLAGCYE